MGNHPIRFGLIAGGLQMGIVLILYFVNKDYYLSFGSLIEYIVFIYFMVLATQAQKKDFNGFISLTEAFKPAWLTYILAASLTTIFTFILLNYIDPDLAAYLKKMQIEAFDKAADLLKLSEADKMAQKELLESAEPYGLKTLAFNLPFSFILPGALLALIIAAFLKKDPIIKQS
jgi:hypothetical protein